MSKLTNYIKKEFSKGFSKENIKSALIKAKYPEEAIDRAFYEIENKAGKKKRLKKAFKVIGIILLAVILVYLIFLLITNIHIPTKCDLKKTQNEKDMCYYEKAMAGNNLEYCGKIKQPWIFVPCGNKEPLNPCRNPDLKQEDKDQCWYKDAIKEISLNDCINKVKDKALSNKCVKEINTIVLEKMEIDLCGRNEECILNFAVKKNNPKLCQNEKLFIFEQENCIIDYAKKTGDLEACDMLDTEEGKSICKGEKIKEE